MGLSKLKKPRRQLNIGVDTPSRVFHDQFHTDRSGEVIDLVEPFPRAESVQRGREIRFYEAQASTRSGDGREIGAATGR